MSRGAKVSLLGMYYADQTILDGVQMPEGVDVDAFKTYLLGETSSQEILYPEPNVLREMIAAFYKLNIDRYTRIYETTVYDYNPFENYDITTEETRTPNLVQTSENSGTDTSDSFVKAFNDGELTQNGQAKATLGTKNEVKNTGSEKIERHEHGDASVRSASQVVIEMRQERLFSFWKLCVDEFSKEFCLGFYN